MKYVIIIPDGSSDHYLDELDGKTPLEVANTPNMDKIANEGFGGLTNNVPDSLNPGSDVANMSIFGYNPEEYYTGRGPLEAGSIGIKTSSHDIIFRCNLITEKEGNIDDFNASHISSKESEILIESLNEYFNNKYPNFKGKFYAGISYRNIFVYNCKDNNIEELINLKTIPPHDILHESINKHTSWNKQLPLTIKDIILESKECLENHEVNKKRIAKGKKPGNMIWLWGQGLTPSLPNYKKTYGLKGAVITGVDLLKGIGVFADLDIIDVPGATGYFDTDYEAKGRYAVESLKDHDIVFIHIEAPDEAGHSKDISEKIKAIEKIDKYIVGPIIKNIKKYENYKIAILPDHPTPVPLGTHTREDVPLIIYSSNPHRHPDEVSSFCEKDVLNGSIEKEKGHKLVSRLINNDF